MALWSEGEQNRKTAGEEMGQVGAKGDAEGVGANKVEEEGIPPTFSEGRDVRGEPELEELKKQRSSVQKEWIWYEEGL